MNLELSLIVMSATQYIYYYVLNNIIKFNIQIIKLNVQICMVNYYTVKYSSLKITIKYNTKISKSVT